MARACVRNDVVLCGNIVTVKSFTILSQLDCVVFLAKVVKISRLILTFMGDYTKSNHLKCVLPFWVIKHGN